MSDLLGTVGQRRSSGSSTSRPKSRLRRHFVSSLFSRLASHGAKYDRGLNELPDRVGILEVNIRSILET